MPQVFGDTAVTFRPVPKPEPRPKRAAKPLPKVNPVRAAKRYERDFGEKGDWIRRQPCCLTGKRTGDWYSEPLSDKAYRVGERKGAVQVQIVAAHFPSRGAGGRSQNLVPMAWHLHQRGHDDEKALAREFGVDFKSLAAHYEAQWQRVVTARLASPKAPPTE